MSKHPYTPPIISVESANDRYSLVATSYGQTMPAGPRLFRAPPWPDIAFEHDNEAAASHDAGLLQRYLDEVHAKRGPSRKAVRAAGAD